MPDDAVIRKFSRVEEQIKNNSSHLLLLDLDDEERHRPNHRYAYDSFIQPAANTTRNKDSAEKSGVVRPGFASFAVQQDVTDATGQVDEENDSD